MNIMLFSRIIARSGVGIHMDELAHELVRQGHNVTVVAGTNDMEIGGDVDVVLIPEPKINPAVLAKDIKLIRRIIKEKKINIVHCHHRMASLVMGIYNRFYKIPVVYTLHSCGVPADPVHRAMTYHGDQAIGVSSEVSRYMIDKLKFPAPIVNTVFNGVNILEPLSSEERAALNEKWNIGDTRKTIALHSRIDENKNHLLVVEALKALDEETRNKVLILCDGTPSGEYYELIRKKIEEYGLEDSFRFVGWSTARDIIGMCDALCLPSRNEGFPLSVCEAFLLKKPVIRTRTAGFDDVKYCIPIDMDDATVLARRIEQLVNNDPEITKDIENEYAFAMDNLTIEKMTQKTVGVYKKALKLRKR